MILRPPIPKRPQPKGRRAKTVVEWADVAYYVFWLIFCATAMAVALVESGRLIG